MDTLYLLFYLEVWDIASKDRDLFINEQIRAKEVMVIGPNGEQLGIKSIKDDELRKCMINYISESAFNVSKNRKVKNIL